MTLIMSFVKCFLPDLRSRHHFGGPAPKESSSLIFRGSGEKERKQAGVKKRKKRRWRGRDRESGQTCTVLLGHSSTHGLSARLKAALGFKRKP